jgi:hypothetical protein
MKPAARFSLESAQSSVSVSADVAVLPRLQWNPVSEASGKNMQREYVAVSDYPMPHLQ